MNWREDEQLELAAFRPGLPIAYFAYGSNMNLPVLRRYLTEHNADPSGIQNAQKAVLDGWQIRTNYLIGSLTGAANIEPAPGKHVEGVLMEIVRLDAYTALQRKEGWPVRYEQIDVTVRLPRHRHAIKAMTYVVTTAHSLAHDMPVAPHYRETILDAAEYWGCSRDYCKRLRKILRPVSQKMSSQVTCVFTRP